MDLNISLRIKKLEFLNKKEYLRKKGQSRCDRLCPENWTILLTKTMQIYGKSKTFPNWE